MTYKPYPGLPPFRNGVRVVPYFDGAGTKYRVDYKDGRGFDVARLAEIPK